MLHNYHHISRMCYLYHRVPRVLEIQDTVDSQGATTPVHLQPCVLGPQLFTTTSTDMLSSELLLRSLHKHRSPGS